MTSLNDVIDPLCALAHVALSDPYGFGITWSRAVADRKVIFCPNGHTDVSGSGQIVVGKNLRGHVSNSFVVDMGNGCITATNSVVAGNSVRVRAHGITHVIGKHAKVKSVSGVTRLARKDVCARNVLQNKIKPRKPKAPKSNANKKR